MPIPEMLTRDETEQLVSDIKQAANELGRTPIYICIIAGMSHTSWYNWLNGLSLPQTTNAHAVRASIAKLRRERKKTNAK